MIWRQRPKTYGKSAYGAYLQAVVRGEIQY